MKKKILSLVFLGIATLFISCSSDDAPNPVTPPPVAEVSSSSTKAAVVQPSSSSVKKTTKQSSSSSVKARKDTTYKHVIDTVLSGSSIEYPYRDEREVFCFTEGCEKTVKPPPSSSSKSVKSSSSGNGGITIDDPTENKPAVVNGLSMTDTRDNQTYTLMQIGGKLWMAQDINYQVANSECYNEDNSKCKSNGRLYTFNAAQKACPLGWRLPTRNEAQAALNDASVPWSYSGRCKDGTCDFLGEMGFHWTSASPQNGDKNFEENKGDSYTVIIVEKDPEYAGDKERLFFQVDSKTKRFSVRCVQE